MSGNFRKYYMGPCREPMTGQKTWTKHLKDMDIISYIPILKSDQKYMMMS